MILAINAEFKVIIDRTKAPFSVVNKLGDMKDYYIGGLSQELREK